MVPRAFHLAFVLLGCAVAQTLQGLPPGVTLVSPRPNATHVTDAVFVSVAFDVLGRCVMGSLPAAPGCTICAALDGQPPQCVRQADAGASELTTGMAFRLGLDLRYLPSGAHSLALSFLGFDSSAASGQEHRIEVPFTSSRFIDGVAVPRPKPRTVIDAFTFFDEVSHSLYLSRFLYCVGTAFVLMNGGQQRAQMPANHPYRILPPDGRP